MFQIASHPRYRRSPFYEASVTEGVTGFMPYNQMLMPTGYGDPEAEYWRLIEGVSQWDVAGQRQVQITGPDATRLAQILTARDLSKQKLGQGKYVPLVDHNGTLIKRSGSAQTGRRSLLVLDRGFKHPVLGALSGSRAWSQCLDC